MAAIFLRCSSMAATNSSDVPERDTVPPAVRRERNAGSAATVCTSRTTRSLTYAGISRHPKRPTLPSKVRSGYPASLAVGTSGACGERSRFVTNRSFAVRALMVGNERRHPRRGDMQTSRRQILQCRGKIAIAHRHHLNSGALLQREHDVIGQAGRGSPIELAWPPTGDTDEIRERLYF